MEDEFDGHSALCLEANENAELALQLLDEIYRPGTASRISHRPISPIERWKLAWQTISQARQQAIASAASRNVDHVKFTSMLTSINSLLANSDIKGPHEEVKLGKSHVASIEAGTYKYYKVAQTDSKSGVYMELSANRPVVDLYASNTNPMPTMEKHMWKSAMRAGAEQGMFMDGHKACTYYVAVTSRVSVDFRLTFHTRRLTRLMDGRIVTGSATLSSAAYYRFKMTDPYAVLVLDVTPLSGDPDLYVSNTALFPSTESYTWRSCGDGGDTIIVNRRDMNFRLGWYYIAVYASGEDSAFSLCARSCKGQEMRICIWGQMISP